MRDVPLADRCGGCGGGGAAVARVKGWVEELRGLAEGESVMAVELRCSEPGCPPVETSVSVLGGPEPRQGKVHCTVAEVTREDVARVVENDIGVSVGGAQGGS